MIHYACVVMNIINDDDDTMNMLNYMFWNILIHDMNVDVYMMIMIR